MFALAMETRTHTYQRGFKLPDWLRPFASQNADGMLRVVMESPWKKGRYTVIYMAPGETITQHADGSCSITRPYELLPRLTISKQGLGT